MTHIKVGCVSAFINEKPPHSRYNIKTLCESLRDMPDLQMVVISNGCKPSEELKDYLSDQSFITFLELSANIGLPAAWNLGIDHLLDCDYVFFLNDDLWLDSYCIYEIIDLFNRVPRLAVAGVEGVYCKGVDNNFFPVEKYRYKKKKRSFYLKRKIIDVTNVSGFLFAVKVDFIKKTGFRFDNQFAPAFCEEFDLAYFARKHGYKCSIITGLDKNYDHIYGTSNSKIKISYMGESIWSDELSDRNVKLFSKKWRREMHDLMKPEGKTIYDESFFSSDWFKSWEFMKHILKDIIMYNAKWKRILDFGCGPGIMIDFMNDSGVEYIGYDYSLEAKGLYLKTFGKYPEKYLTKLPEKKNFDLFLSFDVFEHLTDSEIEHILDRLKKIQYFLLNISREKGLPGHINIKSDWAWISFFTKRNFEFLKDDTKALRFLYKEKRPDAQELWNKNMFLFRSKT
jgi:2-polyprenyl-3-methyl-5-hydroxy-6-metoxy-1,4-benzoquinol methylase